MLTRRRLVLYAAAPVFTVLLLILLWVELRALAARGHLNEARERAVDLREALVDGDTESARRHEAALQREVAIARRQTNDVVWRALGDIPVLGDTVAAIAQTTTVIEMVSLEVVPPLVRAVQVASPRTLVAPGGRIDVRRIEMTRPHLATAATGALRVRESIPGHRRWVVWPVRGAIDDTADDLRRLTRAVVIARQAAEVAPGLLGADQPRKYFLAVQNPAEARGTGGLVGAYAIVEVDEGRLRLRGIDSNTNLESGTTLAADLPPEFRDLYGLDPALWANSNMSPHFPYAARLWLGLWQQQHGERLDGAIGIDVVTMGYLSGASRPIRLSDGTILDGRNLARFIMSDLYERYPLLTQERERDRLTAEIGEALVANILRGRMDLPAMLRAVTRAIDEGRLQVYSTRATEQAQLARTPMAGVIPDDDNPFLAVVINNGGANKLDYYLEHSVRWERGGCEDSTRRTHITVTLRNHAPSAGLPIYVVGQKLARKSGRPAPPGTSRLLVYVHTTHGSRPTGAELDGRILRVVKGRERGHPVHAFSVDVPPGETRTARFDFTEPAGTGEPTLRLQPLVRPATAVITSAECDAN